ncbi:MAG: RluA family pseudouridine synthase [Spirochaetia bacterium]|nr:MAG: RluA family pseudouridine synthase [Spirochaetia bacterium]
MLQNEPFVIYKDKNFLAVYKPAGLLVHPAGSLKLETQNLKQAALTDWLLENYPEVKNVGDEPEIRPGIVHRLDKDVSGIMLIARNQKYFEYLKNLFQTRQIKKNYLALVYGEVKSKTGTIDKPISIKTGTIKRTVWQGKNEKEAVTEYEVIKYYQHESDSNQHESATFSLLKVSPKTGRTHQIRIHLASIGHPIIGDSLYGKKTNPFGLKRIFLHAESLEFSPAEGERIKLEAELPDELKGLLKGENFN